MTYLRWFPVFAWLSVGVLLIAAQEPDPPPPLTRSPALVLQRLAANLDTLAKTTARDGKVSYVLYRKRYDPDTAEPLPVTVESLDLAALQAEKAAHAAAIVAINALIATLPTAVDAATLNK